MGLGVAGTTLAACQPKVVEKVVKETVVVEKEVEKEKVVKETVEVEKEVTRVVEVEKAEEPVELIVWGRGPNEEEVVWSKIVPLAEEAYPEIKITLQAPAEKTQEKLLVSFAGGTAPDSAVTGLSSFRAYIGQGMMQSLQAYVETDSDVQSWLPDYVPAAMDGYSYKGELYGVPLVNEGILFWYNKDAIEDAGLTPPAEFQNDKEKWNWDTVVDYAKKLNKGDGFRRERFGIVCTAARSVWGFSESWGNLCYARGVRFLDPDGEKFTFNSPETAEALQWVIDLIYKHDVMPDVGDSAAAQLRDRAFFQNGQVATVIQGEFFRRYLWGTGKPSGGLPFNYDLCLMPFCPATERRTNVYHGNGSFMSSQTKHPDQVWKWFHTLFSKEAQQIITDFWGSRGAHTGTYQSFIDSNAGGGPDGLNYQAFMDADKDTAPYPTTIYMPMREMMEPVVRIMYDNVFVGKMTVQEGLDQMEEEVSASLKKAKEDHEKGEK
jgi:multiple sugar transport system substrate-binding protein